MKFSNFELKQISYYSFLHKYYYSGMKELQADVKNFNFNENGEYSDDDYSDTESNILNILIEIIVKFFL